MATLGHYDEHPTYRGVAYACFKQFAAGQGRTQMPTVEIEAERDCEFIGGAALTSSETGVPVIGPCYELFTDPQFGMGYPDSKLMPDSFNALAVAQDSIRIAPYFSEANELSEQLAQLTEYADGWFRRNVGHIEAGYWDHGNVDTSALLELGQDDLAGEPEIPPETWVHTINDARVTHLDRLRNYKENMESEKNQNNRRIVGEPRVKKLQRPWIIDRELAKRYATEYVTINGLPGASGSAPFLREKVVSLLPGDRVKVNAASFGLTYIMQVHEVKRPADDGAIAHLVMKAERGLWPENYVLPAPPHDPDFKTSAVEITRQRVWEMRDLLKTISDPQIVVLAQRPSDKTVGFHVHLSSDGGATYERIAAEVEFAAYGRVVNATYPDSTDELDLTVGIQIELLGVDDADSQSDIARDNNDLLLVFNDEVASVGQRVPLGAGVFRYYLRRARYGTRKRTHAIGSHCWFMFRRPHYIGRDRLPRITSAHFTAGSTRHFKLQPYTEAQAYDLAQVTAVAHTFAVPPSVDAPFGVKVVRLYNVDLGGGVAESHVEFAWDYGVDQDVASFQVVHRSAAMGVPLPPDWSSVEVAATNEIVTDTLGFAVSKRQRLDLVVGSRFNWLIEIRAISTGGDPSDYTGISGSNVTASTAGAGGSSAGGLQFKAKAELEATLVTDIPVDTVVLVTINNATQFRQLQNDAPDATVDDWNVLNEPTKRWRQTGGLSP